MTVFDETFPWLIRKIQDCLNGNEKSGDIAFCLKGLIFFYRIAPTVFEDGRRGVSVILEDITEQKRADDALRESEDRYRKLVEISPDAVFLHREGRILYANPAALRLLGASHSDDIIGKNILDFIPPDFQDRVRTNIEKDLKGEPSPRTELTMLRIDGTSILVEGRGIATVSDGKPAVQVAIRDITEQKQAEEALRQSEDLYRTLAESSNDLIFVIGRDDRVEYVNSYASAMVNKPVNQIIGGPRASLFPPEVARIQKKTLETVFGTGAPVRNEGALTFAGRMHWFDHFLTPLKDTDNCVRSILGISRDITERKNAEKQIHESEQLYQRLLEQSFDAIAIHKDKKIAYLNEKAAKILGAASPEELSGRPIFDMIHPDSRRDLEDRLQKLSTDSGIPVPVTTEKFYRVNGTVVTVEVMAIQFDDNGIPAIRVAFREIASQAGQ